MRPGHAKTPFAFGYSAIPLMVLLPPLVYYMWWCMVSQGGAMAWPSAAFWRSIPLPTARSTLIFGGWFLFQMALQAFAPGPRVEGTPLGDGRRLAYRMNGWLSWWLTWAALGLVVASGGLRGGAAGALSVATTLYDELGPLITTANVFTFLFGIYLYRWGKRHPDDGSAILTGNRLYDYFMGTSLNPRNGAFDWKLFCEARPGLIGWVVVDLALAAKQYELHGRVSTPMVLVCLFQAWYVADYYFHEEAILTTWDIKHENFGWMLCWGDLVWVPFTYTLQALYLVHHPGELPVWAVVGIVTLNVVGYVIFRGTNIQKHHFRNHPDAPLRWWGGAPEFIATVRGPRLLTNGFWGIARHLNYLGDLMMGLAWSLPCGFGHLLPYFYPIYFTMLLVHRERRDHGACAKKYGRDWDAYCARVRWRILPGVY
jgi:Delta14-sterol reductase